MTQEKHTVDFSKLPFHEKFKTLSRIQAAELFNAIPELTGLAITPAWSVRQLHVPVGLLTGRDGALRDPADMVHMAEQLWAVLEILTRNMRELITHVDQEMGKLATRADDLMEKVREREQRLRALDESAGGSPPAEQPASTG